MQDMSAGDMIYFINLLNRHPFIRRINDYSSAPVYDINYTSHTNSRLTETLGGHENTANSHVPPFSVRRY